MTSFAEKFAPFAKRMQIEGLPDIVIRTFEHYYKQLAEGQTGLIPETDIRPVESLPDVKTFPEDLKEVGHAALTKTVFLKLNGGLGTSMGLDRAKSLLLVKNKLSFLDIIAKHALHTNSLLVLMNSFATHNDSLTALEQYPQLRKKTDIPLGFLQHKVPKVTRADLSLASCSRDPNLEWCPPGHGDIFTALVTSGMLDTLLETGYEYTFISNADNLGAVLDTAILGYFIKNKISYMAEVADRTHMDTKGGHLAQRLDGQPVLRELAQCPPEDMKYFQDISRHKYFNTNSLWLHLPTLKDILVTKNYIMGLPLICNAKQLDPRDSSSTPVYQLETAMGAAISIIEGAQAIRVPRTRFIPIKNTKDLLPLRSDAYTLADDFRAIPNPDRKLKRFAVDLDPTYYRLIADMEARFPYGTPSLIDCEQLSIKGDVKFGHNVTLKGRVEIVNKSKQQQEIPDNTVIKDELYIT